MSKRFKKDFKRRTTHLITPFFATLIDKKNRRGNPFTIHMITHWFYGRAKNPDLEAEFERFLNEKHPDIINDNAFEYELQEV